VTDKTNYTVEILERLGKQGSRDAIVSEARRISGAEAVDTVLRFAAALRGRGVQDGDGVALFVANSPEAVLLQLAVHFAGARLVFVPPEPGNGELEALIRLAEVKVLLFDPIFEQRTRRIAADANIPYVFSIGPSPSATDFVTTAAGVDGLTLADAADGRHIATLLYTGGTTGRPKLVVHRSGYYDTLVTGSAGFTDDASADPTMMICTLVTHTSGHVAFLLSVLTGHTAVILRSFEAGPALAAMDREQVTAVVLVPAMLYDLLDHPGPALPALRTVYYLGAAASPTRLRQAIERFGPVLHQIYGASENGVVTQLLAEEHDPDRPETLTSCGRPADGVEVELRDEQGRAVPVGQAGEIYVRSLTMMDGYWNDPERTAEVLDADGWFRSGDIARQDENGFLYLVDRARDIIVTARTADNVYSRLLDDFLAGCPGVREAATIGLTGPDNAETVHVVLVVDDPAKVPDYPELTRLIVEELGDLYAPESYSVAPSLPRTTVGKMDKKALRAALMHRVDLVTKFDRQD
jgi:fatty-acyl-CoA synthase